MGLRRACRQLAFKIRLLGHSFQHLEKSPVAGERLWFTTALHFRLAAPINRAAGTEQPDGKSQCDRLLRSAPQKQVQSEYFPGYTASTSPISSVRSKDIVRRYSITEEPIIGFFGLVALVYLDLIHFGEFRPF
jgi:hypothetical protein